MMYRDWWNYQDSWLNLWGIRYWAVNKFYMGYLPVKEWFVKQHEGMKLVYLGGASLFGLGLCEDVMATLMSTAFVLVLIGALLIYADSK